MSVALVVDRLGVVVGGMPVVADVSFEVGAGDVVALVGRNGAGKTTTLRAVAGLEHVTTGRVLLDGREAQNRPAHEVAAAGCTLVLEGGRIFKRLTVQANLRLGAFRSGRAEAARCLADQLRAFPSLARRLDERAGSLSGGEQTLLALAQGLMASSRVLLLDEPTVGLDAATVDLVVAAVADRRDHGVAVLVADQEGGPVAAVADRVVAMDLGRVVPRRGG